MTQPQNRSLCVALGRLRFVIVTACWLIALSLLVQVLIWSLCSFTDLRYSDTPPAVATGLIVDGNAARGAARGAVAADEINRPGPRWRPDTPATTGEESSLSAVDSVFKIMVTVARTMGLMGALVICPLLSLGLILAVPAGARRAERAVNALTWAIVLVLLAMPLGGWFGMAWQQGTISDYRQMVAAVEVARDETFTPQFYARFLLLPVASAVGFFLVGQQFNSAVAAVLMSREGVDPDLEKEASNVAATSLHSTGRTAGALSQALERDRKKKKKAAARSISQISAGEMPKRII